MKNRETMLLLFKERGYFQTGALNHHHGESQSIWGLSDPDLRALWCFHLNSIRGQASTRLLLRSPRG